MFFSLYRKKTAKYTFPGIIFKLKPGRSLLFRIFHKPYTYRFFIRIFSCILYTQINIKTAIKKLFCFNKLLHLFRFKEYIMYNTRKQ